MAKEESISVEETNKIRASLGLKPLRVDTPAAPPPPEAKGKDDAESLSIAETNKVRLALGLKPLTDKTTVVVDDDSSEAQDRKAVENFKRLQEEKAKAEVKEKKLAAIRKAQEIAARHKNLEGKGLADEDDEVDAATWVKREKKRQKALARKREEEEAEREREMMKESTNYGADDLQNLKVAHEMGDFEEGDQGTILTLKDSTILDNDDDDEDELINTDMVEAEKLKERLQLKKRKPDYNPYDDEDESGERRILAKYDEEIDGKKKKQFKLGDLVKNRADLSAYTPLSKPQSVSERLKRIPIAVDFAEPKDTSDYVDPSTIKIKKPKNKKDRASKRAVVDDDIVLDDIELDVPKPKRVLEDVSFVDDEELSHVLAIQRRAALKKRKVLKPDEIAAKLREQFNEVDTADLDEEGPGLIIDDTSEFVNSLQAPVIPDRRHIKAPSPVAPSPNAHAPVPDIDEDVDMEDRPTVVEEEQPDDAEIKKEAVETVSSTGLAQEETIGIGTASMLKMLKERQLLQSASDPETHDKLRHREHFLAEKRAREVEFEKKAREQRERDRQSGKFDRMTPKEREEYARWENQQRERQEARAVAERFKDYKPDVKLEYKDEHGRSMTQKEAFKYLSHQFHGKGSGKQKTEKKLKKIEDEKKREAASSLNDGGMMSSMANAAKKSGTAGVRLA